MPLICLGWFFMCGFLEACASLWEHSGFLNRHWQAGTQGWKQGHPRAVSQVILYVFRSLRVVQVVFKALYLGWRVHMTCLAIFSI